MEQDLEKLKARLEGDKGYETPHPSNGLQALIQLAQAEQLQGIRKALEGILEEMKAKPKEGR